MAMLTQFILYDDEGDRMATAAAPVKGIYRLAGYTYFHTVGESVEPTVQLIEGVESELLVLTGELCPDVWSDPRVRSVLVAMTGRANPPKVEVIFGPAAQADPGALAFLKGLAREHNVTLYETPDRQQGHFMLADRLNVKVEDPHKPNAVKRTGYVSCGDTALARRLHTRFELTKQLATLVRV
jgi:hypothetical protein